MATIEFPVQRATPQNGAENVSLNAIIEIVFTENMLKDSVEDPARVTLTKNKEQVPAQYNYSGISRELTIQPDNLENNMTYQIRIESGDEGPISSLERKQLRKDWVSTFSTEYIRSEEPTLPSEDDNNPTEDDGTEDDQTPIEDEERTEVIIDPFEPVTESTHLVESFPEPGDLIELNGQMVFVFNKALNKEAVEENTFIKESNLNHLLEKRRQDELIRGTVETGEGDESTNFLFVPNQQLKAGQEYQVVIKKEVDEGMAEDVRITFHTLFERMFASVDSVRLTLGRFADRLTDLDIAKLINQQSNSIYQLASMMESFDESEWTEVNGVITTFPYAASQYVVYSTAYYSILGQSLETSSGLSESISLADLSVSGSSEVSDSLSDLLNALRAEFERWWNVLQGEAEEVDPTTPNPNYTMTIATRAGTTSPYPDFQTRVPFNEIGGGE